MHSTAANDKVVVKTSSSSIDAANLIKPSISLKRDTALPVSTQMCDTK